MCPIYLCRTFLRNLKYWKKYSESEYFSPVAGVWYRNESKVLICTDTLKNGTRTVLPIGSTTPRGSTSCLYTIYVATGLDCTWHGTKHTKNHDKHKSFQKPSKQSNKNSKSINHFQKIKATWKQNFYKIGKVVIQI